MPLSRRRAFGGKLYERETGGTANVFLAAERLEVAPPPWSFAPALPAWRRVALLGLGELGYRVAAALVRQRGLTYIS